MSTTIRGYVCERITEWYIKVYDTHGHPTKMDGEDKEWYDVVRIHMAELMTTFWNTLSMLEMKPLSTTEKRGGGGDNNDKDGKSELSIVPPLALPLDVSFLQESAPWIWNMARWTHKRVSLPCHYLHALAHLSHIVAETVLELHHKRIHDEPSTTTSSTTESISPSLFSSSSSSFLPLTTDTVERVWVTLDMDRRLDRAVAELLVTCPSAAVGYTGGAYGNPLWCCDRKLHETTRRSWLWFYHMPFQVSDRVGVTGIPFCASLYPYLYDLTTATTTTATTTTATTTMPDTETDTLWQRKTTNDILGRVRRLYDWYTLIGKKSIVGLEESTEMALSVIVATLRILPDPWWWIHVLSLRSRLDIHVEDSTPRPSSLEVCIIGGITATTPTSTTTTTTTPTLPSTLSDLPSSVSLETRPISRVAYEDLRTFIKGWPRLSSSTWRPSASTRERLLPWLPLLSLGIQAEWGRAEMESRGSLSSSEQGTLCMLWVMETVSALEKAESVKTHNRFWIWRESPYVYGRMAYVLLYGPPDVVPMAVLVSQRLMSEVHMGRYEILLASAYTGTNRFLWPSYLGTGFGFPICSERLTYDFHYREHILQKTMESESHTASLGSLVDTKVDRRSHVYIRPRGRGSGGTRGGGGGGGGAWLHSPSPRQQWRQVQASMVAPFTRACSHNNNSSLILFCQQTDAVRDLLEKAWCRPWDAHHSDKIQWNLLITNVVTLSNPLTTFLRKEARVKRTPYHYPHGEFPQPLLFTSTQWRRHVSVSSPFSSSVSTTTTSTTKPSSSLSPSTSTRLAAASTSCSHPSSLPPPPPTIHSPCPKRDRRGRHTRVSSVIVRDTSIVATDVCIQTMIRQREHEREEATRRYEARNRDILERETASTPKRRQSSPPSSSTTLFSLPSHSPPPSPPPPLPTHPTMSTSTGVVMSSPTVSLTTSAKHSPLSPPPPSKRRSRLERHIQHKREMEEKKKKEEERRLHEQRRQQDPYAAVVEPLHPIAETSAATSTQRRRERRKRAARPHPQHLEQWKMSSP